MSKKDQYPQAQPKRRKKRNPFFTFIRRLLLLLFTIIIMALVFVVLVMNMIFKGPSPAAREVLTMSLLEPSATKWIPGLFLEKEELERIKNGSGEELVDDVTDTDMVVIKTEAMSAASDEWANYPDGIRIESYSGKTFNAHIMIIRDPSRVYMATSASGNFSESIPGTRINEQIETEQAAAAVNAGAFLDDGTATLRVGSVPAGLVFAGGVFRSNQIRGYLQEQGFAGFNQENKLIVSKSMTQEEAEKQGIRDGCEFGPVLIINGNVNLEAYNSASGYNPRTAIGQRADGAVVFLCIDGRQASSIGGTYRDAIDIMVAYGCVNACNMDGGSSSVMLYRDTLGVFKNDTSSPRFGANNDVVMVNKYSVLQSEPRRMPDFWMVKALQ